MAASGQGNGDGGGNGGFPDPALAHAHHEAVAVELHFVHQGSQRGVLNLGGPGAVIGDPGAGRGLEQRLKRRDADHIARLQIQNIAGQINLAQIAFFGVSAYATAILTTRAGLGFWTAAALAMLISAAIGVLIGTPALRMQSHYLGIVTLGLALALINWVTNAHIAGGAEGMRSRRAHSNTSDASGTR